MTRDELEKLKVGDTIRIEGEGDDAADYIIVQKTFLQEAVAVSSVVIRPQNCIHWEKVE